MAACTPACLAFPCFDVATSYACLQQYQIDSNDNTYSIARAELERMARDDEGPRGLLPLSLAQVAYLQEDYASVVVFARSATYECLLSGQIACEMQARRFLSFALDAIGDYAGAVQESEKTFELSRLLALPEDQVKAASALARHRLFSLNNIPRALEVLDQSAHLVANVDLVSQLFFDYWRGRAAQRLGQPAKALLAYRNVAQRAPGSIVEDLGLASHIQALGVELQMARSPQQRQRLIDQLEQIRAAPDTAPQVRIRAEMVRHQLAPGGANAQTELADCAITGRELNNAEVATRCETQLAMLLAPTDVAGAQRWLATASAEMAISSTPEMELLLARARLRTLWNLPISPDTVSQSLRLLSVIESGRNLQRLGDRAPEFLGFLNDDHYWLADQLMEAVERQQLAPHFARDALRVLSAARAGRTSSELIAEASRVAVVDWITWRTENHPSNPTMTRSQFDAREQLQTPALRPADASIAGLPLTELEAHSETLVLFQWHHDPNFVRRAFIVDWPNLTSVVLDPEQRADQLLSSLETAVFSGDEQQVQLALAGLAETIIQPLSDALSADNQRLILLPDGILHGVPLGALPGADARIVGAAIYGSLSSWAAARQAVSGQREQSTKAPAFRVFAAPALPTAALPGTTLSANPLPLPAARVEAQDIQLRWPDSKILAGQQATESAAVAALTSPDSWVHFAAHAKIQTSQPLLSSLQLAADDNQDGWLTVKEISKLHIPGNVVVLSACESASGRRLSGEGLIGLTTALVDSGASAVLANLWPVDDALAAQFIRRWYARLAYGEPLTTALAQTRTDFADAGYPASSWAGWTLLGENQAYPLAKSAASRPSNRWMVIFVLLGIIITGVFLMTLAARRGLTQRIHD